jgi:hypothetical protein
MTTTHTPGPWARKRRSPKTLIISRLVFAGDDLIAAVHDLDDAGREAAANARLISAAPELLAVLQDVADYWAGGDAPAELDARMRAVIAIATGEG